VTTRRGFCCILSDFAALFRKRFQWSELGNILWVQQRNSKTGGFSVSKKLSMQDRLISGKPTSKVVKLRRR